MFFQVFPKNAFIYLVYDVRKGGPIEGFHMLSLRCKKCLAEPFQQIPLLGPSFEF